jgi:hypothetical protein
MNWKREDRLAESTLQYHVEVSTDGVDASERCFSQLAAEGFHLPMQHRAPWLQAFGSDPNWFVLARSADRCRYGFAVECFRFRALPGHRLLRVKRLGPASDQQAMVEALRAACALARREPWVLRLNVEVFGADATARERLVRTLVELGFTRARRPWSYHDTVTLDLSKTEEEILASFHPTARRHIRAVAKRPVEVGLVTEQRYADRMEALLRESLDRTAGEYLDGDYSGWIELGRTHPDLVRVVGMFSTEGTDPERLWAFAIGYHHGNHVEYGVAASTRDTGAVRLPMGYALAWDLTRWAKATGAQWFDFGGITEGSHGEDDPLGGISDFKRYFSKNKITVGDEWVYEPRPVRAALARAIGGGGRRILRWTRLRRLSEDERA